MMALVLPIYFQFNQQSTSKSSDVATFCVGENGTRCPTNGTDAILVMTQIAFIDAMANTVRFTVQLAATGDFIDANNSYTINLDPGSKLTLTFGGVTKVYTDGQTLERFAEEVAMDEKVAVNTTHLTVMGRCC
eukprot:jgi/Chrzof1/2092/Cz11g02140.t1